MMIRRQKSKHSAESAHSAVSALFEQGFRVMRYCLRVVGVYKVTVKFYYKISYTCITIKLKAIIMHL
jgi:hypothetical protein